MLWIGGDGWQFRVSWCWREVEASAWDIVWEGFEVRFEGLDVIISSLCLPSVMVRRLLEAHDMSEVINCKVFVALL